MDIEAAIKSLLDAIQNVEGRFILVEGIPNTKVKKEQVERSFAYELYHQWSLIINEFNENLQEEQKVTLNGEITKYYDSHPVFPDMVLHGGQSDIVNQLIVCEIKRRDKRYPTSKSVCNDIEKLDRFLRLTLPSSEGCLCAKYQLTVFIMVNIAEEELKRLILKSLKLSTRLENIKENANKVLCVSYNPSKESKKGDVKPKSFLLADILKP